MGEAASAACEDAEAAYWNPAAMTRVHRRSATLSHVSDTGSSSLEHAAFAQSLGHSSAWGASLLYRSSGRIAETDAAGIERGGFTPSDLAVSLAGAYDLGEIPFLPPLGAVSLGLSAKYVESRILSTARTWALDVGALSPPQLDGRLRLAATLRNLGGELRYESDPEPLPLEGRVGAALRPWRGWLVSLDGIFPRDDDPAAALGTELALRAGAQLFAARAGFNSTGLGDLSGFSGFSFGAGWGLGKLGIDYGFLPMGPLGISHRFTLRFDF